MVSRSRGPFSVDRRRWSLGPFAIPGGNERPKINQISRPRWSDLLELGSRGGKRGQALKFPLQRLRIAPIALNFEGCPLLPPLEAVPGVTKVVVSYQDKTAVVTYDDAKTNVKALTAAPTNTGYPSAPRS